MDAVCRDAWGHVALTGALIVASATWHSGPVGQECRSTLHLDRPAAS